MTFETGVQDRFRLHVDSAEVKPFRSNEAMSSDEEVA